MAASITLTPIVAGLEDEWRSFVSELHGPRRIEWVQSQRRRGITREVVALAGDEPSIAVVYFESADPTHAADVLATSTDEFDWWYRSRLGTLLDDPLPVEVVFDSAPRRGPWRGWR